MQPHLRFTALFWALGSLVDEGKTEDVAKVQAAIADGTLFTYLEQTYPDADISLLSPDARANILKFFQALSETVDHRRKFGIEHNGLMLLLAYAVEGIQQSVDNSHELG